MNGKAGCGYMNLGLFSDKVIEHFMSPRNVGSMTDADGEGSFGGTGMRRLIDYLHKSKGQYDCGHKFSGFWLCSCRSVK